MWGGDPTGRTRIFAIVAGLGGVCLFLSAPLTITFDSAHYLGYLTILRGEVPLDQWDVVRGPVFPIWLWCMRAVFGTSPTAALVVSGLCLGVTVVAIDSAWSRCLPQRLRQRATLCAALVVAFDPTSFGYFHTLLTEYLAATLFSVGLAIAAARIHLWSKGKTFGIAAELGSAGLAAFAYHLKQPYLAAIVFPLVFASVWAFRHSRIWPRALGSLALTLGVVSASIFVWGKMLPNTGPAADGKRSAGTLAANTLAATCLRASIGLFRESDSNVDVCASPSWRDQPEISAFRLEAACEDNVLSNTEAAGLCLHSFGKKPLGPFVELVRGLGDLYSFGASHEHFAIAHRTFRAGPEQSPVFWLPDAMKPRVESYAQPAIENGGIVRLLGRLAPLSLLFHAALGVLAIALALASLRWIWRLGDNDNLLTPMLFVASSTAAAYSATLVVFGLTIDRYQYPIFPVAVVAVGLAFARWLISRQATPAPKPDANAMPG